MTSCHDWAAGWAWIENLYYGQPEIEWRSISTLRSALTRSLPGPHLGRVRAALQVAAIAGRGNADMIVSHGPYVSYYLEAIGRRFNRSVPHFAFSFNFTDIPQGYRLDAMRKAFAHTDKFFVFSNMERHLYSRIFEVPVERFVFMRWGVAPPIAKPEPRTISEPYVAAIGGEARDYEMLCKAARLLPNVIFVLVTRPDSLRSIDVPENVQVHVNLPWDKTWSLVSHAQAALVPLRSSETANGHVTIVGAMHLGKAIVVTDSIGIRDYIEDRKTGLLVPPADPRAFAKAIEQLLDDTCLSAQIGEAAQRFSMAHCSEAVTVETFRRELLQTCTSW